MLVYYLITLFFLLMICIEFFCLRTFLMTDERKGWLKIYLSLMNCKRNSVSGLYTFLFNKIHCFLFCFLVHHLYSNLVIENSFSSQKCHFHQTIKLYIHTGGQRQKSTPQQISGNHLITKSNKSMKRTSSHRLMNFFSS